MTPTLLVAAGIHTVAAAAQPVRCLVVEGDRITWVGADPADAPATQRTVDLGDAWITPALVDAHVHATITGLSIAGVELRSATSAAEVLDRVRRHAGETDGVVLGAGWDDFGWPEGAPPTAAAVGEAAPGRTVLLLRVDGHSCVVDPATLSRLPLDRLDGVDRAPDGEPTGWLREAASEAAQQLIREELSAEQTDRARLAACEAAAALGIGSIHEMSHPGLSGLDDARAWAAGDWPLDVAVWWAELDVDVVVREGLRPGGDLFLDGSIGSGTAATSHPYSPHGGHGELFNDDDAVADWFSACTAAGLGGGVHAIGDRAIEQGITALEAAAARHGLAAVRACRHRLEHVELPTRDQVRRMAALGVVASVQPAFDAVWGGDDQLYAERFGVEAARASNPFAWFSEEGVAMAFGSDSTVTPLDPWGGVAAATAHLGGLSVSPSVALAAATVGGRFVAGQDDVGALVAGNRADLACWSGDPLRAEDPAALQCLATVVRGAVVHGDL